MHASLSLLLSLATATLAVPTTLSPRGGRTSAPAGCLSVGNSSKYKTVQSAVNALSASSTTPQCIFIAQGTYKEQVYLPPLKSSLALYGETTNTLSFASNTVTITQGKSQDNGLNNDQTATLRAWTPNLKVYNINLVNTRGKGSQALALSASATRQGYYACQFRGFQDTLLAQEGTQVYAKSYVEGATDFIFGQRAQAWFDGADIRVLAAATGYVTANGRDSATNPSYYVINNSTISAAAGNTVKAGAFYLGRPWRNYARVVVQATSMTDVINAAGWSIWNKGDEKTDHVEYGEFGNTGAGAGGSRAKFAKKLGAAVGISTVLGADYTGWVDTSYLA